MIGLIKTMEGLNMKTQSRKLGIFTAICLTGLFASKALATESLLHDPESFSVEFENCQEFAGLYPVEISNVAPFVPNDYIIASQDGTTALVVFRTAECARANITGDDNNQLPIENDSVILSQVGVAVVPPLGMGDVNNYTIHYGTNNKKLAGALKKIGIKAKLVKRLEFDYESDDGVGSYFIENSSGRVRHVITGPASAPPTGEIGAPFVANWWENGITGNVRMQTYIPELRQGNAAEVIVTTEGWTIISDLLGGNISGPSVFGIRGIIPNATMDVSIIEN